MCGITRDPSFSPAHDLVDSSEEAELTTALPVDRENSFEDLEQFLNQLDWAPSRGGGADDHELTFEPGTPSGQQGSRVQELEVRALREHLKAIVKDIHISIGEGPRFSLID